MPVIITMPSTIIPIIAMTIWRLFASQKQLAKANSGKRIQINASPNEYAGKTETAEESKHTAQKARQARTQKNFTQPQSFKRMQRAKKTSPHKDSHKSAGLRSISRIRGPQR